MLLPLPIIKNMKLQIFLFILIVFPILTLAEQLPPFKVNAVYLNGENDAHEKLMQQASVIFEKVMNDKEFQEELKTKKFQFDRNDDPHRFLTTEQIVKKLFDGKELYESEVDNEADIYWTINNCGKSPTRGAGFPSRKQITTYRWFINSFKNDLAEITGHLAHEWTHKFGFIHQKNNNSKRPFTVPYSFGYLVRKHAKKYI